MVEGNMPEELMAEIEEICLFYSSRGWDWKDAVMFAIWRDAGCPTYHWTLKV